MSDMIQMLRRELEQLEAELRGDPRYVKIQGVKDLLAVYVAGEGRSQDRKPVIPVAPIRMNRRSGESKNAKLTREVTDLLRQRGTMHRSEILAHLISRKILGKEKNPMAGLAQFLSKSKSHFTFDGEGNWSLVEGQK